jgi:hypothetical protein
MLEERCQAFAQGRVKIVVLDLARSGANAGAEPRPAICVPYRAETLPNGEADMAIIRMRQALGLEP